MKRIKKSANYEPTISDILEVVQSGFVRNDKLFTALHEGQENIKERLKDVDHRLVNTQNRIEDVADTLEDLAQSAKKDKITILSHERRIQRLEQVLK